MALLVNWALAQTLFEQGFQHEVIAKRIGVKPTTLSKRAYRQKWAKPLEANHNPLPARKRSDNPLNEVTKWKSKIMDISVRHLAIVADKSDNPKLSIDELDKLVRITGNTDMIARRTLGLDVQESHLTVSHQHTLHEDSGDYAAGEAVEVETIGASVTEQPLLREDPDQANRASKSQAQNDGPPAAGSVPNVDSGSVPPANPS